MKSIAFVQQAFREYYTKGFSFSENLSMIEKREFGFALFEGWMLRHKNFDTRNELISFLGDSVPRDAYFSCAYYEDPQAAMEKKGWSGADLVFDIDADHIPTSCDKVHDLWTCGKCGFTGKGVVPENCPVCGGEKFDESTWPCEACLASAKHETMKLLDILMKDFGFSDKEIRVFFSGHRGYHVHVENEAIKDLDSVARKEIVDYVCGLGLDIPSHGLDEKRVKVLSLNDPGWRGRIAKGIHNFVFIAEAQDYRDVGLKGNVAEAMVKNKGAILRNLNESKPWEAVKGVGPETWKKIIEHFVMSQSANVDTVVTTDTHRLIRLGCTLHGKTGLKKTEFPVPAINDFDPFKSAIAFREGTATVLVSNAPEFRLGDQTFGPYKNQKIELPTAAAVLLICRKRAEVIE
ncbi:MAG: DNA primase small subunit PriS [Candidatus Bathyarchaeia archaeon]